MPSFPKSRNVLSLPTPTTARTRRSRRRYALEPLESRTLLTFTFVYTNPNLAVVNETGPGNDSFTVINNGSGLLEWATNSSPVFSTQWGAIPADTLNADPATSLTINSAGNNSDVNLGISTPGSTAAQSASAILAKITLGPNFSASNGDRLTIDDSLSNLGAGTYTSAQTAINTTHITGPLGDIDVTSNPGMTGGATIIGNSADNIFDVPSVYSFQPLNIQPGSGSNTVNIGMGTVSNIAGTVSVSDSAVINIDDSADTTHPTATIDDLSGNVNAPFELTGLGNAPIEWGAGVTAVNITGGTSGVAGVTYNVNNTQSGTTTTINAGPNPNFINLSNAAESGGLDNLPGPVVVHGGTSFQDVVTLDDSDRGGVNDDYVVTSTTVSRPFFGGLTYDDNIGTLTLLAENTLGADGNNTIDINSTADFVITNINGQGGVDTINVNDTGILGTLNVTTGPDDGSTVNVLATNEPVNITGGAVSTVNIGSTGGPGTMANIQGPISVTNPPSLTDLIFHDENDTTAQTWTLDNDDGAGTGSVAVTGSATTSYDPFDLGSLTVNAGSGGNTFNVDATSAFYPTTLNTGDGDDTTNVFASGDNTLDIHGQGGQDTVILGADPVVGAQNLFGTINVDNVLGFTDLTVDDSANTTGVTALLFNDGTNGQITGLSPSTINYVNDDTSSLTVFGGSGGNTFTVDGTISSIFNPSVLTDLNTGFGDDTTFVEATAAGGPLNVHGQAGQDSVLISDFGSTANILGTVTVDNAFGFTDLTVDTSADLVSHDITLANTGPQATLTTLAPADIIYTVGDVSSLTISTSSFGNQVLNIDMSGGNPIPFVDTPGLIFNAGADFGTAGLGTHAMNIFGALPTGPFASETHNANDPNVFPQVGQYGSIFFDDGQGSFNSLTSINYTGLLPINDTTPAIDYTFNDFADDQSFSAASSTVTDPSGTFDSVEFANTPIVPPPTFETTDIANKNFVTFNANNPGSSAGLTGVVNVPTASDGLLSLTFNTLNAGDNTVSFVNTPPGVVTSLNGGADEDVTNVTGLGVPAGTVLFLNGGAGSNTLNYDAGGETPTITPGLLPGEVLITIPGAGIVDAINYQTINIINAAPIVITPGPPVTINTVENFQNVDAIVGTFTTSLSLPGGPVGFPASDFTASIDWGDPSPDPSAGVITQDASNPSIYYIAGTHTFLENGTYTVTNSVAFAGGSITVPVNGVPINFTFGPSGPTAGADATANVTQGPLAVTALPIVGTEGIAIPAGPIATFIDAGGADDRRLLGDDLDLRLRRHSRGRPASGNQHRPERQRSPVHGERTELHAA